MADDRSSRPNRSKRSLPYLLDTAIEKGDETSRLQLGIVALAKKYQDQFGSVGPWYVALRADSFVTPDGPMVTHRLLGERLRPDLIRRFWVETVGEALELHTFYDAIRACELQGIGTPVHQKELHLLTIGPPLALMESSAPMPPSIGL